MKVEAISDQMWLKKYKNDLLSTNNFDEQIRLLKIIAVVYDNLGESQKSVNLRVLLTQLEIQNEAIINRMKSIIND